jgi:alginate O-acetyltransferase complex protein AlgJ
MRPLTFSHSMVGATFCALLLMLPVGSAWNLLIAPSYPKLAIKIGPKLGGVTYESPVSLSWSSLRDRSFQKAVASRVTDAMPVRPLLIRINNEIRFELFGELTAPHVIRGAKGNLIERFYLDEYCSRTEELGATLAADIIPKLRDIQNYFRAPWQRFSLCDLAIQSRSSGGIFRRPLPLREHADRAEETALTICRQSQTGRYRRGRYREPDPFA